MACPPAGGVQTPQGQAVIDDTEERLCALGGAE